MNTRSKSLQRALDCTVFFSPADSALRYRVKVEGETGLDDSNLQRTVPIGALAEIPGESKMGLYNYDVGEITPIP